MELRIHDLTKEYGGGRRAVDSFSLTLRPGVLGLLGANGALPTCTAISPAPITLREMHSAQRRYSTSNSSTWGASTPQIMFCLYRLDNPWP